MNQLRYIFRVKALRYFQFENHPIFHHYVGKVLANSNTVKEDADWCLLMNTETTLTKDNHE